MSIIGDAIGLTKLSTKKKTTEKPLNKKLTSAAVPLNLYTVSGPLTREWFGKQVTFHLFS